MAAYLRAWLQFGVVMGVVGFASTALGTRSFLRALLIFAFAIMVALVAGLIMYGIYKRSGRVDELLETQRNAPSLFGHLLNVTRPPVIGLYLVMAAILTRAAGGPLAVYIVLISLGLVALWWGRRTGPS